MSTTAALLSKALVLTGAALTLSAAFYIFYSAQVTFESLESLTSTGGPVYNSISYSNGAGQDVWMMNQSHSGISEQKEKWDRLAIVVDKQKKIAKFYQLPPGELVWSEELSKQSIPFRVSCFLCHSNGPRAIRPKVISDKFSLLSAIKIWVWNLKIKSYGPLGEHAAQAHDDIKLRVPFRLRSNIDNEQLKVKRCVKCHNRSGPFSRGFLTRQNGITINFMIKNKLMPPSHKRPHDADRIAIENFLRGF